MDSNKDEAAKCMRIGRAAIEAGDKQRALKFLSIAKRLYPSPQVDALISSLHEENGQQGADDMETDVAVGGEESGQRSGGQREQNVFMNGKHQNGYRNSSASTAEVSVEHREIVRKINKTKDFYQILGLEKGCTEDDVRKAYRKLSLKVHPDKNKAPGAEEAFKAVSKAFQVLNNVELREDYDRYGPEERETSQQMRQQHHHHNGRHGNVYYEDMFDPNDIFNSFFFGMQQPNGPFRRAQFVRAQMPRQRATAGRGQEGHSSNLLGLLQLLPILALFIFSFFPFSQQPVYNLESVAPYQILQKTSEHGVSFYVKSPDFQQEYPHGSYVRRQVESQIEKEYLDILVHNCRMEMGLRRWGQTSETPYCDRLHRFQRN
jgi:DnaJ family protein B protein 12